MAIQILHCYKSFMPDVVGGIAESIATVTSGQDTSLNHTILVSRPGGFGRDFLYNGIPVRAVTSLGTIASSPIAPTYPLALAWRARSVDLIVHHSPSPLTDLGVLLGIPRKTALIVHWHADLMLSAIAKLGIKPLLRHSLNRADRIIIPHESVMHSSSYLHF